MVMKSWNTQCAWTFEAVIEAIVGTQQVCEVRLAEQKQERLHEFDVLDG